jgi:hypothetical protein
VLAFVLFGGGGELRKAIFVVVHHEAAVATLRLGLYLANGEVGHSYQEEPERQRLPFVQSLPSCTQCAWFWLLL